MKTIIAGSRDIDDYALLCEVLEEVPWTVTEVVSGHCMPTGNHPKLSVDLLGERWAAEHGVPVRLFPAKWKELGKRAGYVRNVEMALHVAASGDGALVALWDGKSKGTKHMIDIAKHYKLRSVVWTPDVTWCLAN